MTDLKAIVMDMDGTLLNEKAEISKKTRETLIDLEKQGVKLVLASGRSYMRLLPYAYQLEMEKYGGWLIEVDGVAIYNVKTGERQKFHEMSPQEIYPVYDWLTHQDAEAQAMFDDGLFAFIPQNLIPIKEKLREERKVSSDYPWTAGPWSLLADLRDGYPNQSYIQSADEITRGINKLQIMQEEQPIARLYQELQDRFADRFSIYRTTPTQLEVIPLGFSKGAAVERLMKENHWKPDQVAVFGDGENDCSMFEKTPLSFAMENARDYVKKHARYQAGSNAQDGIVQGLKQIIPLDSVQ